ncbi:hypothetical protein V6N11_036066 [Hibiscus sabdariffa]|uniref:Uncharacterized protein n=1 Tax=Hibiscus sabdariffa TaxID=183260 RepID=A0ABR2R9S9_9ROSI
MSYYGLSGPIHSSLSSLRSLSVICLDHNYLSASTLDLRSNILLEGSFRNFPLNASLKTLALCATRFEGHIPESLGNLGELTVLDLAGCNFSGHIPKALKKLTQLVHLDFSWNNLSGPIPSFSSLRNLEHLDLASNQLSGTMPSFSSFKNLMYLDLGSNRLTGTIQTFSSLRNLTDLNLAFNQLSGALHSTDWSGLSKLVRGNKLSGTIPPTLFGIPSLQELFLSQNQFNSSIGDLHGKASLLLTSLDISSNKLQGQFPMSLFELQELEGPVKDITSNVSFLDLHDNRLRGRIPFLPRAIYLDYSNNKLNSGLPAQNAFTGPIPSFLGELRALESIDLSSNGLRAGPIPTGTQIQSFSKSSFENNVRLCGPPLKTMCGSSPAKKDNGPLDTESGNGSGSSRQLEAMEDMVL